jgi:aspartate/methionine/tyrosine aminotransferase
MVACLRENRDFVRGALEPIPGITIPQPRGAFYLFPHIEGLGDSFEFCRQLLIREKVGIAPGGAFGAGGEGSVRICYAADRTVLEAAVERIARFIREMPG